MDFNMLSYIFIFAKFRLTFKFVLNTATFASEKKTFFFNNYRSLTTNKYNIPSTKI